MVRRMMRRMEVMGRHLVPEALAVQVVLVVQAVSLTDLPFLSLFGIAFGEVPHFSLMLWGSSLLGCSLVTLPRFLLRLLLLPVVPTGPPLPLSRFVAPGSFLLGGLPLPVD
jgi:hypothetical protein